jgi:hypothetical protein
MNPFETPPRDEVQDLLELWAEFMGRDDHKGGFKGKDPILQSEGAAESEQLYDRSQKRIADTVAAIVDSLHVYQQAALFSRYGLATVFRFKRLGLEYDDVLVEAMQQVRLFCAKRGLLSAQYRCRIAANGDLLAPKKREARMTA